MPVRDMGYQHAKYMEQIKAAKESNQKTSNYPNPMTKELNDSQKLSPVITLVLNYSQKEWEKPKYYYVGKTIVIMKPDSASY